MDKFNMAFLNFVEKCDQNDLIKYYLYYAKTCQRENWAP